MEKPFFSAVIIALLILAGLVIFINKPAQKPLNVIVIDVCTLRPDHLSFNGYKRLTTPNIDQFAKQSTVFENAWTQANWCLPNISTLYTGARPEVHKMLTTNSAISNLAPEMETLAGALKKAGYKTAGFAGTKYLKKEFNLSRDFDTFINPFNDSSKNTSKNTMVFPLRENMPAVEKWLGEQKGAGSPLFLYISVDDMHSPYVSQNPNMFDQDYKGVFDSLKDPMSAMDSAYPAGSPWFNNLYNGEEIVPKQREEQIKTLKDQVAQFKASPGELEHLIARYDADLYQTDGQIGQLISKLKESGLWDNSVVIITSHQGEYLGEHGLLGHSQGLHEEVLRSPLLIHVPGQTVQKKISGLVERIDIAATILDIGGVLKDNQQQFTGESLLPFLNGKVNTLKKYSFASTRSTMYDPVKNPTGIFERAVRNDTYKLMWKLNGGGQEYQLFDLIADPHERKDIKDTNKQAFDDLKNRLDMYVKSFR